MPAIAAVGYAQDLNGREAGLQAVNNALNQIGNNPVSLGIVIAPYRYEAQQVINGVSSMLGNTPLIGFSSTACLTREGSEEQGVVVALLGGEDIKAETHWFPAYSQSTEETAEKLTQLLNYEQAPAQLVFGIGDGFNGDAEEFCAKIPGNVPFAGCLSSGDINSGFCYQIANTQYGSGGLSAMFIRGDIKIGIGHAHGWIPVGSRYRVTRSRGFWLRTLDGRPASESYAQMFGYPARDWAFPPLNQVVRIYPLGIERGAGTNNLLVRSPLRVEADGSFRMNTTIRDGTDVYLLTGSPNNCVKAAREAAQQAKDALGNSKPLFTLALVDTAWQTILQATPGAEMSAIQTIIGEDTPLAGGYTLGQIIPAKTPDARPQFMNQHIMVIAFGTSEG